MDKELTEIMAAIIKTGGSFCAMAKMYLNDERQAKEFVLEFKDQIRSAYLKNLWGEELIKKIAEYCDKKM
jgi:hypothetical protein